MSDVASGRPNAEARGTAAGCGAAPVREVEPAPGAAPAPFWRTVPLADMTPAQWESLCDGCGRCCLVKLEDEDTGGIVHTDVACALLDARACRCRDYANRQARVPDCLKLTPAAVREISWLPPTCAYRIVARGGDLPWWHPLVSGRAETVVEAGVSVRGRVGASEEDVPLHRYPDHVVTWPARWPRAAKRATMRKAPTP